MSNEKRLRQEQHDHGAHHERKQARNATALTIRLHSGLSGDMFLAGLLRMTEIDARETDLLLGSILPELAGTVVLTRKQVHHISGWHAKVNLPHQHEHRTLEDILQLIKSSGLGEAGKDLSINTFTLLAEAEARVHGIRQEEVCFHEVGALDSIVDVCLTCELFARLAPDEFIVSPLPMTDGSVSCAHGDIPVPAPAVLELLSGLPVVPFSGRGETVTPTGIALLHGLGASFGPWPAMYVEKKALVYGSRIFHDAPNGTIFAYGPCIL